MLVSDKELQRIKKAFYGTLDFFKARKWPIFSDELELTEYEVFEFMHKQDRTSKGRPDHGQVYNF